MNDKLLSEVKSQLSKSEICVNNICGMSLKYPPSNVAMRLDEHVQKLTDLYKVAHSECEGFKYTHSHGSFIMILNSLKQRKNNTKNIHAKLVGNKDTLHHHFYDKCIQILKIITSIYLYLINHIQEGLK